MIKDASVVDNNLVIMIETGDLMVMPLNSAHAVETACCRRNLIYCADAGVVNKLRSIAEHNIPKRLLLLTFRGRCSLVFKVIKVLTLFSQSQFIFF